MQPNIFILSVLVNHYVVETSPHATHAHPATAACKHNCPKHTHTPKRDQNHALNVIKTMSTNSTPITFSKRKQTTAREHVQTGHTIQVPTGKKQGNAVGRKKLPQKCKMNCRRNRHAKLRRASELRKKTMQRSQPQKCHNNCSTNGLSKTDKMSRKSRITPSDSPPRGHNGIRRLANRAVSNHIRMKSNHRSNEAIHKKNLKANSKNKINQTATNSMMSQKHAGKRSHVEQKRRFSIPVPLPLLLSKVASIASLFRNDTSTRNVDARHRGETSPNDASIHSNFNWGKLTALQDTKRQNNVRSPNLGDRFSSFIPGVKKDVMTISRGKSDVKDAANTANIQPKEYSGQMNDVTTNSIQTLDHPRTLNDVKPMPGDDQVKQYAGNTKDIHTDGNASLQSHSTNTMDDDKSLTRSIEAVKKNAMAEVGASKPMPRDAQPREYNRNMKDMTTNTDGNAMDDDKSLTRSIEAVKKNAMAEVGSSKPMPRDAQPREYNRNMKDMTIQADGNASPQSHSTNTNDKDKSLTSSIEAVKKDAMAEVGAISEADVSSLFMNPLQALHSAFSKIATKALPRTLKVIGDIADVLKSISKQEPETILKKANLLYRRGKIPKHAKTSHSGKHVPNLRKKIP